MRGRSVAALAAASVLPIALVMSIGSMPTAPATSQRPIDLKALPLSDRVQIRQSAVKVATTLSTVTTTTADGLLAAAGIASSTSNATPLTVIANSTGAFQPGSPDPDGGDAGDADVVESGGVYYAFTTGTALGNHIQVLVNTSGNPQTGYQSSTGEAYGSSALPDPPSWETANTQTSPGVIQLADGTWIMYYDAATGGAASDTGHDCISYASAPSLSPSATQFTDSSASPFFCPSGHSGWIDPAPFIDPVTHQLYLIVKSNDGGSSAPAYLWAVPLSADGTSVTGTPSQLLYNDTVTNPWEATVEDPSMAYVNGRYYLLFSGGIWDSSNYAEGYAVCGAPTGPCSQPQEGPVLTSYGSNLGPGGGVLFQDAQGYWWMAYSAWTSPCTAYSCGGARQLYIAPVSFGPAPQALFRPAVGIVATPDHRGYWAVASDGGVFTKGDAGFFGSLGGKDQPSPVVALAPTPDGQGYWEATASGEVSAFGDATFDGSLAGHEQRGPVVAMVTEPNGQGYWLATSTGQVAAFGAAGSFGSVGGQGLNAPIVGMATTPDGQGYWLVGADGGVFAFGDAAFYGSEGGHPLNAPIVGMATTGDGQGYWLVASDGGVFAFGDAQFEGSTGSLYLRSPISGLVGAGGNAGYWLIDGAGDVYRFGDAGDYGAV